MWKKRIIAISIFILGIFVAFFVYQTEPGIEAKAPQIFGDKPFTLGLDLSGGTHLIYRADLSEVAALETKDAMDALRDVIERRINIFGVTEPVVQIEHSSVTGEDRLIVDLPGVTDITEAVAMIGQTPLLEFKVQDPNFDPNNIKLDSSNVDENGVLALDANMFDAEFISTDLTGRQLDKATLQFDPNTHAPIIGLEFNDEGAKLFEEITAANVGKPVAIYLDGSAISTPNVNEKITGGTAVITGNFTPEEAKQLVGRLNSGALPVPIELISTQTIGASLGAHAVEAGVMAGLIGFLAIAIFLIIFYRLPGLIAVVALSIYVAIMLALFKIMPVTLSAPGIAGFIISIGLAVDANVLIFERMKEEMRNGRTIVDAMREGFERAWPSIRDSNISTIISMAILFWFGTSLIKGFALTFGLGVLMSMLSAITLSRRFLYGIAGGEGKVARFLFSSGFSK